MLKKNLYIMLASAKGLWLGSVEYITLVCKDLEGPTRRKHSILMFEWKYPLPCSSLFHMFFTNPLFKVITSLQGHC